MSPRKMPPPATAARSPKGAGRRTRISAIGIDIWTSMRAMCRAHHVPVVVSNSTQPRCRSGSRPPIAYHSQRWGAGRTTGSEESCSAGSAMAPGCSCSTTVTPSWCHDAWYPNGWGAKCCPSHSSGAPSGDRALRPGGLARCGRREGLLGGRDHLGERRVQVHQPLDRHAEPLDDAGRDPLGLLRSEEHTSELQSRQYLVCRLLLEKKNEISNLPPSCDCY